MNKRTIIACTVILSVLSLVVALSVYFLYSGTESKQVSALASDSDTGLLSAIPSDAVAVVEFEDLKTACRILSDSTGCFSYFAGSQSDRPLVSFLKSVSSVGLGSLKSSRAVVSLHYNGSLVPLLAIDAGRASAAVSEDVRAFMDRAASAGFSAILVDGSATGVEKTYLSKRNILLLSTSEVFVKSSERHIAKAVSVLDSDGFTSCASMSQGSGNRVFIACTQAGKLFNGLMNRSTFSYAEFIKKYAGWVSFSIEENESGHMALSGRSSYEAGSDDFLNVFDKYSPSKSQVASVLPYYTAFFVSLPISDVNSCIAAMDTFWDATGRLDKIQTQRKDLQKSAGMAPVQWASDLDVKEIALACFRVDDSMQSVLLLKTGNGKSRIFKDSESSAGRKAESRLCQNKYDGFPASVFGSYFNLEDESAYTLHSGWAIIGSKRAVAEYVEGRALENTLADYMKDASLPALFSVKDQYFWAYCSVGDAVAELRNFMKPGWATSLGAISTGYSFVPAVFGVSKDKSGLHTTLTVDRVNVVKSKAPVFERDTVVIVPPGPFKVKNSGTGEMNYFYQQRNNYLGLKTLSGKGLWAVPFQAPICGSAGTVDYFANGKLQILFASGSSLYLIDRLGRYVSPFPVKLRKEILLGPGIYDFNNSRKYNVMVLHKDNTIEMYNLQGKTPQQWKTISSKETIKGLPELIKVGERSYWVVRTSIQTLIFPFYGGEPLTVFAGEKMIRPDTKVIPAGADAVSVVCYDGKNHTVKLKQ